MMNPLYRKMFRDPMSSRKPAGILASSAPMMTAAQKAMAKNQPMKAQTGASVNTGATFFGQQTPGAKFGGGKYGGFKAADMRKGLMDFVTSQVQGAPGYQIFSGDTGRNIAQLVQTTAPIYNPMMSPSFVANNIMKPGDYTALRQAMQQQLSPFEISLLESGIAGTERVKGLGRALLEGPVQAEKNIELLTTRPTKPKLLDMGEFEGLENLPETPALNLLPSSSSSLQDDPALAEQQVITPDITDADVGADMEDDAAATTTQPSVTANAQAKLNSMLQDLETGNIDAVKPATADVAGPKKFTRKRPLTIEEGTTSEATMIYGQVLPEKVSLSEVEEELKSQFDLDPSKYDEKKQNAFWLNLTMAGLAIAAGESENALTNIAKGLMVGVDSYGKDLKDLNAQEREDQKEYRSAMRQLISDKRSENIAVAQMQNSWNMGMNELNQNQDQFESRMEFDQAQQEWSRKIAGMQLTASITNDIGRLALQQETLDYTKAQDKIKNKLDVFMQSPDHVQTFISAGLMQIDPDTGMPKITTAGEDYRDIIIAASFSDLTGSDKSPTDTTLNAQAIAQQQKISLAEARTLLALGGGRLEEGVPITEVMAELNIVPGAAGQTQATLSAADIQAHQSANDAAKATGAKTYTFNGDTYNVQ